MSYNIKFVDSSYDSDIGYSWVKVRVGNKIFIGESLLSEEDKNKESKYAGCRFAELKAELKALKYLRRRKKEECEYYRKFVKSLGCYKNFDKNSPTAKCVYKQLNKRIKEVNQLTDAVNAKREEFLIAINQRDLITKAIDRKKKAKES